MSGRTVWLAKDAAWWRRGYVVELGQAHGPAGPAVLDWLACEAKSQGPVRGHDGSVKAAYSAIAHATFTTPEQVREIVETAVEVGALDDFEGNGRTFTCRISGWQDDVERPLAATRRATQRAAATPGDTGRHEEQKSPDVAECPPTREGQEKNRGMEASPPVAAAASTDLDQARQRLRGDVGRVFDEWRQARTETLGARSGTVELTDDRKRLIASRLKTWPVDDLVDAVRGWRHSPHHRGENERGTVYADLKLLLRDADHIERFRDLERQHRAGVPVAAPAAAADPVRRSLDAWDRLAEEQKARRAELMRVPE